MEAKAEARRAGLRAAVRSNNEDEQSMEGKELVLCVR